MCKLQHELVDKTVFAKVSWSLQLEKRGSVSRVLQKCDIVTELLQNVKVLQGYFRSVIVLQACSSSVTVLQVCLKMILILECDSVTGLPKVCENVQFCSTNERVLQEDP